MASDEHGKYFLSSFIWRLFYTAITMHTTVVPENFGEKCPDCGNQVVEEQGNKYCVNDSCEWAD